MTVASDYKRLVDTGDRPRTRKQHIALLKAIAQVRLGLIALNHDYYRLQHQKLTTQYAYLAEYMEHNYNMGTNFPLRKQLEYWANFNLEEA